MAGPLIGDVVPMWIFLFMSVVVTSTGQHKHLMLLISGSTRNFDSTWNLYSYNDPTNNKSDWDIFDLINGGEYKAHIDPSWGDPEWVYIDFLNAHADVIGEIQFNVPGFNITSQTSWMPTTFDLVSPLNLALTEASFFVRDGDMELLVREPGTFGIWTALVHSQSGLKPIIAINASNPLSTESVPQSLGCKPNTSLDISYQFKSTTNMTVQNCYVSACSSSTYEYVGIKFGTECYCVNITISDLLEDYPGNCTKTCAGDPSQKCGGTSPNYLSVYDAINQTDNLLSLEVQNATALTVYHNGFAVELTINVGSHPHWPDDHLYMTGIRVSAENHVGNNVTYSFEYRYHSNYNDSFIFYETHLGGTEWFGETGTSYELDVLLITEVKVKFQESAENIVVELIGPIGNQANPAYVTAEYLHVIGLFNPIPTKTTTVSTTTTAPNNTTTAPKTTTSASSISPTTSTTLSSSTSTTASPPSSIITTTITTAAATTTTTATTSTTATPTTSSHLSLVSITTSTLAPSTTARAVPSPTTTSPSTATTPTATTTTTSSPSTVVYSNYSILVNGQLYCPCAVSNAVNNSQNGTTDIDIDVIIAALTLDKDTLSSNTRRYNSAEDSRPSARTIGALGVIIIAVVVGFILAMDGANLKSEVVKIKKNYRYLKKQISKRSLKVDNIATISQRSPDNLPDVLT